MIVYPMIELMEGRCVSLNRGNVNEPQIWHVDPVEKARSFAEAGAEWVHITDFDAMAGDPRNEEVILAIIRNSGLSVQLGGGINSLEKIKTWLDHGAGRVVIGSAAVGNPQLIKDAAKYHPDQVVLSIDVFEGCVTFNGWREKTAFEPETFMAQFENDPLAAIVVTDIGADIGDTEEPLSLITLLAGQARTPVIARGLSRTLDDISRMKYVHNISGAIVGRALFDRSIDLADALDVARPEPEQTASFI